MSGRQRGARGSRNARPRFGRRGLAIFRGNAPLRRQTALLLILLLAHLHAPQLPGAEARVLPPSHSVAPQLYATGFAFAGGTTFDNQGNLYIVNYRRLGTVGRIAPDGTASVWCELDELAPLEGRVVQANGLKTDRFGRIIVADAGGGRILRIPADGATVEVLADRHEGTRFNAVNDLALDLGMNIYFTDPGASSLENPVGAIYRYEISTRSVQQLASDLAFPSGIAVSPDQRFLCVSESQRYRILIYDLHEDGTVDNRRVLLDFPDEDQGSIRGGKFYPFGMVFDADGRLFVAMGTGRVINVVDIWSGELVRQYSAGGDQATNCHFYGDALYTSIAAKEAVFRLELGVTGFEYWKP